VFLGSEQYPFKGVLDMAANRLFARGTNAWTATDHTAYTATHAGADGLLALLPVYADHVRACPYVGLSRPARADLRALQCFPRSRRLGT
jgi:Zn-dependent M16 (insulinase) family peptidase